MSAGREKVWGLSKDEADYGPAASPTYECRNCRYMFPKTAVGTCKLVAERSERTIPARSSSRSADDIVEHMFDLSIFFPVLDTCVSTRV